MLMLIPILGWLTSNRKKKSLWYPTFFSHSLIFIFLIRNGKYIGKINYAKNIGRNCETYITADDKKNEILFRYYEFLSPEETMAYLKKNVFVVEGEDSK